MKKMLLGDVVVTVIEEAKGRVLFEHPSGDRFVARRRFLKEISK